MNKIKFGQWGEEKAVDFLLGKGIKIIDRNHRTHYGELDIIGMEDSQVVFFEVKTRSNTTFGFPEEAVNVRKQEHLINSAEEYMQVHTELGEDWRIDVIAIEGHPREEKINIRWYKNAVSG